MSRNIHQPNYARRVEFDNTKPRYGNVPDSWIQINSSEGELQYLTGTVRGLVANIFIKKIDLPEIPHLELMEDFNWSYLSTFEVPHERYTRWSFTLDDDDAFHLRQAVYYYDFLYG